MAASTTNLIRPGCLISGPTLPERVEVLAIVPMGESLKLIGRGLKTGLTFILKPEEAQKLREPPRLHQIALQHVHVLLKTGEQVAFRCSATDQYGKSFSAPVVAWFASGGTITSEGVFTAGETPGLHTVRAEADGLEAIAEVRIASKEETEIILPPGKRNIRWQGSVPPQKWLNFYTKVLSKYATLPELKLEVSFEAQVERDQADAKVNETKASLRELGMDDNVSP